MKLIVGLGNPGSAYQNTRHNIGRLIVEALAEFYHVRFKPKKNLHCLLAPVEQEGLEFYLALPESYMNESGGVVSLLVSNLDLNFKSNLLVVVDDVALPFGKFRLRASGQNGGHRGLESIEQSLGSKTYARLRVGIRPEYELKESLEKYVLNPFQPEEQNALKKIFPQGVESCRLWLTQPIAKAMDRINQPTCLPS